MHVSFTKAVDISFFRLFFVTLAADRWRAASSGNTADPPGQTSENQMQNERKKLRPQDSVHPPACLTM